MHCAQRASVHNTLAWFQKVHGGWICNVAVDRWSFAYHWTQLSKSKLMLSSICFETRMLAHISYEWLFEVGPGQNALCFLAASSLFCLPLLIKTKMSPAWTLSSPPSSISDYTSVSYFSEPNPAYWHVKRCISNKLHIFIKIKMQLTCFWLRLLCLFVSGF